MGFVLGLSGLASSGKGTVGHYMVSRHGWSDFSFARNLKDMVQHVFKMTEWQVDDEKGKRSEFHSPMELTFTHVGAVLTWMSRTHGSAGFPSVEERKRRYGYIMNLIGKKLRTPREILQIVGTDICRTMVPTYHVDIVSQYIDRNPDTNWVITDVRFPDEGDFLKSVYSAFILRLERPALDQSQGFYGHVSENALADWDGFSAVIDNSGSLGSLYEKVDLFLKEKGLCHDTIATR